MVCNVVCNVVCNETYTHSTITRMYQHCVVACNMTVPVFDQPDVEADSAREHETWHTTPLIADLW